MRRRFRQLNRWHWAIAVSVVLIALLGSYRVMVRRAELRVQAAWETRLEATVRDRQAAIERWAQDLVSDGATLATYPTAIWLLENGGAGPRPFPAEEGAEAHLGTLLQKAAEAHGYEAAWVVDRSGRSVAASGRPLPASAVAVADSALRTGRVVLALRRAEERAAVLVATPVLRPDSDVRLGAVVLEENPREFLYPLLQDQPVPSPSGEVLLSERRGSDVYLLSPTRKARGLLFRHAAQGTPAAAAAAGETRFLTEVRDYAGDDVWAATQPIRGTTWGLQAKVDRSEALAPARRAARLELLALSGLVAAVLGIAFGVWRQMRARQETAVAQERARFSALLMHANDAILMMDEHGRIRDVNHRAVEFYERPQEWFVGRSAAELRAPELRSGFDDHVRDVTAAGHIVFETVHVSAQGTRLPVEISSRRVVLQGETMLLAIVRDLTERHTAEQRLRQSEEKYRAIVENTPDVVARLDSACRYLYISPSVTQYSITPPEDFIGRTVRQVGFPAAVCEQWEQSIARVFADGTVQEQEFVVPTRMGERNFIWRVFPEYDADREICAVVTVTQDVTERRRLEEQFQHAQKMEAVGRLAGGVAHDFNNILTAIHGHAALARADVPEDAELARELEEIMTAADRAASLTRQLLAFSRRQILQPRRIDLAATVRAMAPMLHRLIGEQVAVRYDIPAEPLPIKADPGQIEQIVLNLCVNARDAMEDGGRLTILLQQRWLGDGRARPGRYVVLQVTDTGSGMTPDVLEHVFEPFFTTKEQGRGTGLGLSTVYGIVQQSGGEIEVESAPAEGTTFRVYLPLNEGAAEEVATAQSRPLASQEGRTVLVAEDDAVVRRLTERLLRTRGYRVLGARSGVEALELAAAEPNIDLLLTDVVMPEIGGIELARRLRAARPGIVVVFMTGYTHDFTDQAAPVDPSLHIVHKPFSATDLLGKLEAALDAASGAPA